MQGAATGRCPVAHAGTVRRTERVRCEPSPVVPQTRDRSSGPHHRFNGCRSRVAAWWARSEDRSPHGFRWGRPASSGVTRPFGTRVSTLALLAVALAMLPAAAASASPPGITDVSPAVVRAPSQPGTFNIGTFVINGQFFSGGSVTTDGPIVLTGSTTVTPSGTSVTQTFQIGCCSAQPGTFFHLFVTTPSGVASVPVFIAATPAAPIGIVRDFVQ